MLEAKNLEKQIHIKKIDNNTLNIRIFDNKLLMAVVGEFNNNLTEIEKLTGTKLFFRGNSILAKGEQHSINEVSETLKYLVNKFLILFIDQDRFFTTLNFYGRRSFNRFWSNVKKFETCVFWSSSTNRNFFCFNCCVSPWVYKSRGCISCNYRWS